MRQGLPGTVRQNQPIQFRDLAQFSSCCRGNRERVGHGFTGCGKMTQVSNPSIFSNQDTTTYRSIFDSKSPEITTLVHFSAACSVVPLSRLDLFALQRPRCAFCPLNDFFRSLFSRAVKSYNGFRL